MIKSKTYIGSQVKRQNRLKSTSGQSPRRLPSRCSVQGRETSKSKSKSKQTKVKVVQGKGCLKCPKPRSKPKTQVKSQVKVYLDFQGGGFSINKSLPLFIQGLENPSLKEKESEDCIHRDCIQFKSIESIKIQSL